MSTKRILDEQTASVAASDDFLYIDGATNGSRKITPENIVVNSTVAQTLSQHISDAEDTVEELQGDIDTLEANVGTIINLTTETKTDVVSAINEVVFNVASNASDISDIETNIGDLGNLETEDKSSLVGAINEAAQSGGSGSGLTQTEKDLILTLFSKAAYAEDDADEAYEALASFWQGYSVTWQGSGYSKGNNATSVSSGDSFTSTVTANAGFTIGTVTVTMGGATVQGAWSNGRVTIPSVTGDVVITVTTSQVTVTSISAVYTQSGTVYDTTALDDLKTDLVVTATFVDSSTGVINANDYTLSGTLATGTSTITVEFGGKTATFTVTVTHAYTITNNLTDVTNSNTDTSIAEGNAYTATLSTAVGYEPSGVSVTMGGTDVTSTAYDSSDYSISIASVTGNLVITAVAAEKEIWSDGTNWYDGVPYAFDVGVTKDVYIGNSGEEISYTNWDASDYMYCKGATSITAYHTRTPECAFYDENKTFVSRFTLVDSVNAEQVVTVPSNVGYFRISWATDAASSPSKLTEGYYIKPNE